MARAARVWVELSTFLCQIFVLHPGAVLRQHCLGAHGLLPTELDAPLLVAPRNLSPAGFAWAVPAIDEASPTLGGDTGFR